MSKKSKGLIDMWGCAEVSPPELEAILLKMFGGSTIPSPRVIEFHKRDGLSVRLTYDKNDRLISIACGEALDPDTSVRIADAVREQLLEVGPRVVGRRVLFALNPLKGAVTNLESGFKLFEAPREVPQGGPTDWEHPCILEAEVPSSSDGYITRIRLQRRLHEIELLLVGLMPRMKGAARGDHMVWVVDEGVTAAPSTRIMRRGYEYPGLNDVGDFSPTDHLGTPPRAASRHYFFGTQSRILELPDDFEASLAAYRRISATARMKFLRAAHWQHTARRIRRISASGAHVALVNAIESLVEPARNGASCDACGKAERSGPTRLFSDFIETYGPDLEKKDRARLYEIRSGLVHGALLLDDDFAGGDGMSRGSAWDRSIMGLLEYAVGASAHRWLHRQAEAI
jgi:hypothetical protein